MPNYCSFEARIKGKKKNVLKLAEWLSADYTYSQWDNDKKEFVELEEPRVVIDRDGVEVPTEHHIGYRVFSFNFYPEDIKDCNDEDVIIFNGNGDCAWSVFSCMFNDLPIGTYMGSVSEEVAKKRKAISIDEACGMLGVSCEIYSWEPGMCFAEHYLINEDGEVVINEETEYTEIYIGDFEGETWEEYVEFCKEEYDEEPPITKEQFNTAISLGEECICHCDWWGNDEDADNQFAWPWQITED